MIKSESQYLALGRRLERPTATRLRLIANIKVHIAQEQTPEDRDTARYLIERGRQEERTGR